MTDCPCSCSVTCVRLLACYLQLVSHFSFQLEENIGYETIPFVRTLFISEMLRSLTERIWLIEHVF